MSGGSSCCHLNPHFKKVRVLQPTSPLQVLPRGLQSRYLVVVSLVLLFISCATMSQFCVRQNQAPDTNTVAHAGVIKASTADSNKVAAAAAVSAALAAVMQQQPLFPDGSFRRRVRCTKAFQPCCSAW